MKAVLSAVLGLCLLGTAAHVTAAPNCSIKLKGDDKMQFDLKSITVSASCPTITIELAHTGKLPAAAMGHNVVISTTKDIDAIARDGMKAGAAAGYLVKGDKRVLGATALVGGGGKTKATFPGKKLVAGGDYSFFCSMPGHAAMMRGKLVVTK